MATDITGIPIPNTPATTTAGTGVKGVRATDPPASVGKKEGAPEQPVVAEQKTADTKAAPSVAELESMASEVQIHLKRLNTELRFEVDGSVEDLIVRIVDTETNEVIRQVPSEEMVAIRERLDELIGILYDART